MHPFFFRVLSYWRATRQKQRIRNEEIFLAGMHAGGRGGKKEEACGPCVYLSHTLSSLLFLIQGGGVQGFIGNKIGALNVINGFDFWDGS